MVRPPCCDKLKLRNGIWTEEKDAKMLACVSKHGTGNWQAVSKKSGLGRCGKSCRLRWTNYLKPDPSHESFTPQEEELIIRLHSAIGSRWSIIAQQLPGRTDNDVKTHWNTKLRKKLSEMGIDPVTHKPFSQIFADYGNIGGLPRARTRIGSLNRDLKNAFELQHDHQKSPIAPEKNPAPKMEPIEETLLNNCTNSHSLDLLAQLQAITMVTNASNCTNHGTIQPHLSRECAYSSSLSSSSSSTANESSFSWRDFLLEDAFLPENIVSNKEKESCEAVEEGECINMPINSLRASASSDSHAFVEAMLDWENDEFLEFPGLLDEALF